MSDDIKKYRKFLEDLENELKINEELEDDDSENDDDKDDLEEASPDYHPWEDEWNDTHSDNKFTKEDDKWHIENGQVVYESEEEDDDKDELEEASPDYHPWADDWNKTHKDNKFKESEEMDDEDGEELNEEDEELNEKGDLGKHFITKRDDYVKAMKKNEDYFKSEYGDRWKDVMYATASKMAKKDLGLK